MISFGHPARERLVKGVNQLARACSVAIGPSAKSVGFRTGSKYPPFLTSDGVTVAREIILPDALEDAGLRIVRSASQKTNDEAGDGTTSTALLAASLIRECFKAVTADINRRIFFTRLEELSKGAIAHLKRDVRTDPTPEELENVATSAAADAKIGKLIAEGISTIGQDGMFTTAEHHKSETELEIEEGSIMEGGWISSSFIPAGQSFGEYEDCYILLTDSAVDTLVPLEGMLNKIAKEGKCLVLVVGGIHEKVQKPLLDFVKKGSIKAVVVKSPFMSQERLDILGDIGVSTGGIVFSRMTGIDYTKATIDMLGQAKLVKVYKNKTVILGGKGKSEDILARATSIKALAAKQPTQFEREKCMERLSRFAGGVAVLKIGGTSKADVRKKKFRVEDAVRATQSAIEEGVIIGAGRPYMRMAAWLQRQESEELEHVWAKRALINALEYVVASIIDGAGLKSADVMAEYRKKADAGYVFDVAKNSFQLGSTQYVEPFKVHRCVVANSVSVTKMLIDSEAVITPRRGR